MNGLQMSKTTLRQTRRAALIVAVVSGLVSSILSMSPTLSLTVSALVVIIFMVTSVELDRDHPGWRDNTMLEKRGLGYIVASSLALPLRDVIEQVDNPSSTTLIAATTLSVASTALIIVSTYVITKDDRARSRQQNRDERLRWQNRDD